MEKGAKLWRNNGDGTFTDVAGSVNAAQQGEGRGVVAFDADRDGDVDLFVANNNQPTLFLRNDGLTANWLHVKLQGPSPNVDQVGARVKVTAGATTQMREIRCGSNYVSSDPPVAYFGLGSAATATVPVTWTDGTVTTLNGVSANQYLTLGHPAVGVPVVETPGTRSFELLGAAPNPFDQGTAIRFRLGESASVRVRVFDSTGRAVRTFEQAYGAGAHEIPWDGRNEDGAIVGSGVYWYEVSVGGASATGKVIRLR